LRAISYAAPTTVEDAVAILGEHGERARVLAGGTDLIVQVRERLRDADVIVDAKQIDELMQISIDSAGDLTIGAAAPCHEIYGNDHIREHYGAIVDGTRIIGSTGIQGRASIGGNLCNSGPAADGIPPLIVYMARCNIAGPAGRRAVPVEDFCTAPGRNVLTADEMLVSLTMPKLAPGTGGYFLRFIPRNEMDIAVVNVGAALTLDGDTISAARLGLGAVAPTPLFVREAGAAIEGKPADEDTYAAAGEIMRDAARPIDDMRGTIAHRKQLAYVLTQRALRGAAARAQGMEVTNGH
jgi:carbon-monoxide dehydrogenase medium subunit